MALLDDLKIPHYYHKRHRECGERAKFAGREREGNFQLQCPCAECRAASALIEIAKGTGRKPGMQRDRIADFPEPNTGWRLNRRGLLQRAGWAVAAAAFPYSATR